jgi:hypothetical protein
METFILENKDPILFVLFIIAGMLGYNWGHHVGFIKGFRNGRRAGIKHPTNKARS